MKESDGLNNRRMKAVDVATVVAGWSTGLALLVGFATFFLTYQAQERFNKAQLKFNDDQRRFNEAQQAFNDQQARATTQTAEFQAETAAIDALRAYFASGIEASPAGAKTAWLTNDAFFTAETLYNLRSRDPSWRDTAKGLILNHRAMIDSGHFDCQKYAPEFVEWIRGIMGKDPCHKALK